jgi:hypothetical protein
MGMADGKKPLPFGHSAEAAIDIEGLTVCGILMVVIIINIFQSYWRTISPSYKTKSCVKKSTLKLHGKIGKSEPIQNLKILTTG